MVQGSLAGGLEQPELRRLVAGERRIRRRLEVEHHRAGNGIEGVVGSTGMNALQRGETAVVAHVDEHMSVIGAPHLRAEHLPVFACSMGDNTIHYEGHVRMMGAVQPFVSGGISKTVNMPESATAEDIEDVYLKGWKLGLKAIAIYRDGSKLSQPLSSLALEEERVAQFEVAIDEYDKLPKIINDFAKKNEQLEIKAGVIEGTIASADDIKALAELPSREGLLSMLLSVLQAPMRNFALVTKAVAEQKEEQGA